MTLDRGRARTAPAWPVIAAVIAAALAAVLRPRPTAAVPAESLDPTPLRFVGAAECRTCHASAHRAWSSGRHSRMVQPATSEAVRGDFAVREVKLRGLPYQLRREGDAFFITERYLGDGPRERRVHFTLGSRRVQHYLTKLEDGRIVVLPPSWDVERREWFHNLDIVDPEETTDRRVQVWNTNCVGCHVSQQRKGYDHVSRVYDTRWVDFGTSCERCHGPGGLHVQRRRDESDEVAGEIVRPASLDATRQTMICAQCHSLRDMVSDRYAAGDDYFDHFMPILEYAQKASRDPAWWADGRPRRFSNDALGLWQSACFERGGATCMSCHSSAHLPNVDGQAAPSARGNALCLQCHETLGRSLAAHTRHRPEGPGSSCVECHMPNLVFSLRNSAMRDHAIGVPVPENTVRFGIPNACNACHKDRSAEWAAEAVKAWGGGPRRQRLVTRAEAFSGGREGKPAALPGLTMLAADRGQHSLVRANAVGHLRRYPDARATTAAVDALADPHPLVRAVAALTLAERPLSDAARSALLRAAGDPLRTVRVAAAFALVSGGVARLPGDGGEVLERAKREYAERASLLADDPLTQLNLGKFHLLDRRADQAAAAFEAVQAIDPARPGIAYFLGAARLAQGRTAEGRRLLASVARGDPFQGAAQDLLRRLETPR